MRTDLNGQVILTFPLFFTILALGLGVGWFGRLEYQRQSAEWHSIHQPRCAYSDVRGEVFVTCQDQPKHWFFQ